MLVEKTTKMSTINVMNYQADYLDLPQIFLDALTINNIIADISDA